MRKNRESGRPLKYSEVEDLQSKIDSFFDDEENKPYTVTGLVLHLGLTYEGLSEYSRRDKFSATVKTAKLRIEDHINKMALGGGYNSNIAKFNLTNNFGWKEKIEQEITHSNINVEV